MSDELLSARLALVAYSVPPALQTRARLAAAGGVANSSTRLKRAVQQLDDTGCLRSASTIRCVPHPNTRPAIAKRMAWSAGTVARAKLDVIEALTREWPESLLPLVLEKVKDVASAFRQAVKPPPPPSEGATSTSTSAAATATSLPKEVKDAVKREVALFDEDGSGGMVYGLFDEDNVPLLPAKGGRREYQGFDTLKDPKFVRRPRATKCAEVDIDDLKPAAGLALTAALLMGRGQIVGHLLELARVAKSLVAESLVAKSLDKVVKKFGVAEDAHLHTLNIGAGINTAGLALAQAGLASRTFCIEPKATAQAVMNKHPSVSQVCKHPNDEDSSIIGVTEASLAAVVRQVGHLPDLVLTSIQCKFTTLQGKQRGLYELQGKGKKRRLIAQEGAPSRSAPSRGPSREGDDASDVRRLHRPLQHRQGRPGHALHQPQPRLRPRTERPHPRP